MEQTIEMCSERHTSELLPYSCTRAVWTQLVAAILVSSCATPATAESFATDIDALIESSCIHCHDAYTETRLNLEELGHDLADPDSFRQWEQVFDRLQNGEMPPESEEKPDAAQLETALTSLAHDLREANLQAQRENGRVPLRRLTRLEYEYTLHDLLNIQTELAKRLPAEGDSYGFDTVSDGQGISPLHVRSYLTAADHALDAAIQLQQPPPTGPPRDVDYLESEYVKMWYDREVRRGGGITRRLDDAVALFVDREYIMRSDRSGFTPEYDGFYRITAEAYSYQARTPVTLTLIQANDRQGNSRLLGGFDLGPGQTRTVEVEAFLTRGDYIYPSVADLDWQADGRSVYATDADGTSLYASDEGTTYGGEAIAIKSLSVEGPLVDSWPPASTRQLLHGVEFTQRFDRGPFDIELNKAPLEHVTDIVERLGPLAFRRPLKEAEAEALVKLAEPAIEQGRAFEDVVRIPLRAMLSAPQFLFHAGDPGELDDFALATRLSYFLWRTMPDEELFRLAGAGTLGDPDVLAAQVDRMLDDERSMRFIRDFLGQWLRLRDIDLTTPDEQLYPEYDDMLRQAMLSETELFFRELINRDISVRNLIDSEFTFLNRRLAEHYGIPGIVGQHFRRVQLPEGSPRGGILAHASVMKVTANGTLTSPVRRGNFVLTTLLGQPISTPATDVGSIEPDTRGATTIRETLDAHRQIEECASCHRYIDPPGFALESFDVIGGFRTRYRALEFGDRPDRTLYGRAIFEYRDGLDVDASGTTADDRPFRGIRDFKELLLAEEEQVARHFTSQLLVYSTGGEIQFADREELDRIVDQTRGTGFTVRTIIHEVVQSELFRNK